MAHANLNSIVLCISVALLSDLQHVSAARWSSAVLRGGVPSRHTAAADSELSRYGGNSRPGFSAHQGRALMTAGVLDARSASSPRPSPLTKPSRRTRPPPPPPAASPSPASAPPPSRTSSSFEARSSGASAAGDITSRVCGAITLASPVNKKSGELVYTFGKQIKCDSLAAMMAGNLTDAAASEGAQIAVPFGLDSCSSTYEPAADPPVLPNITVCGAFRSVAEATKIQSRLELVVAHWRYLAMGLEIPDGDSPSYFCPPPKYDLAVMVGGQEEGSPAAYIKVSCL